MLIEFSLSVILDKDCKKRMADERQNERLTVKIYIVAHSTNEICKWYDQHK
jgi:hypothetical protein